MSSRQGDKRLIVSFSLTHFAGVVSPGDRIPERGEGRQEQRPFESFITSVRSLAAVLTPTPGILSGPGKEGEQELAVLPQAPPRLFAYAA